MGSFASGDVSPPTCPGLGGPAAYGSYAVVKRFTKLDQALCLQGMHVLDLGCGNGCYTVELSRRARWVCGLDIQLPNLRAFRAKMPLDQGPAESLPFAAESFDAVTMIEVLEHTASDTAVLRECCRVLKTGGFLVLFIPNKLYPFESHPCHVGRFPIGPNIPFVSWLPTFLHRRISSARIYTRRRISRIASLCGFEVSHVGYIFPPLDSFPLPFKNAYRQLAWRLEETPLRVFGVSILLVLQKNQQTGTKPNTPPSATTRC